MKKISFLIAVVFFAGAANCQDTIFTLKKCVDIAIANNMEVQQGNLQMQAAEINWKQARLNMLPDLIGTASYGSNQGRSIDPFSNAFINQQVNYSGYGVSSGVVLFRGLTMQNALKQSKLSFEASKMDWQQQKDNLTINVILAYLQILSNEDQLDQSYKQIDFSSKQVERLGILNKEGAIPPSQLYDLKGQLASDQLAVTANFNSVESSKINLCRLLNISYNKNMKLERVSEATLAIQKTVTPDSIFQSALNQLAIVKAGELRKQSAEKAIKIARGNLSPTLSLGGNVNTNYSNAATKSTFVNTTNLPSSDYVIVNGNQTPVIKQVSNFNTEKIKYGNQLNNNLFTGVSLNLNIPIFNSFQARNKVKLAQIDYETKKLAEKNVHTELQLSIQQAYINKKSSEESYKTLLEQVISYTESFRAAEVRFNSGVGNSIDYLTAKNNLDRANANLISAKFDFILRGKILDYYQGNSLW